MWILGLFEVANWILVLLLVLFATYLYLTWDPFCWKRRGVNGPTIYPFLGTMVPILKMGPMSVDRKHRMKFGKVYGEYAAGLPVLITADEEMMREILVKNFNAFANRIVFEAGDEVMMSQLINLKDHDWRRVRNLLTPTFSTGKLKMMLCSVSECVELLNENLAEHCQKIETFDCRELFGAFTMDVIARTAFGLKVDSQKEKDSEFVRMAKKAFNFDIADNPLIVIFLFFPWMLRFVVNYLGMSIFDKECQRFFDNVVEQSLTGRKEGNKEQKDFIQLMLNAHKEDIDVHSVSEEAGELGGDYDHANSKVEKGLTKTEILAQGFLFFVAGYETTAHTLSMLAYNLALWPEVQEKLYEEIYEVYGDEEALDYHGLSKCPYLDQCIDETLRLYPAITRLERCAGKDVTVGGIPLKKGEGVSIPILAIHQDPEIYPEPEEFQPERFSPENKAKRSPFHYMPFGYGPRNCIGMRLALMEIKAVMIRIVRKYKFLPCEKTERPVLFKTQLLLKPKNGIWLAAEAR